MNDVRVYCSNFTSNDTLHTIHKWRKMSLHQGNCKMKTITFCHTILRDNIFAAPSKSNYLMNGFLLLCLKKKSGSSMPIQDKGNYSVELLVRQFQRYDPFGSQCPRWSLIILTSWYSFPCTSLVHCTPPALYQGWSMWRIEYGNSEGMSLPKLGYKRCCNFCLVLSNSIHCRES